MRTAIALGLAMMLAGCNSGTPEPTRNSAAPATLAPSLPTDAWIGKWVGVEGLALDIARGGAPGAYTLKVALIDGASTYDGEADGDTIIFDRNGKTETIRHTDGAATGLKWLAGKKNCLTIQEGEGFCRD